MGKKMYVLQLFEVRRKLGSWPLWLRASDSALLQTPRDLSNQLK